MEFSGGGWGVGGAGEQQVGSPGRRRRGQRGVRDGGRAADSLGFGSSGREIGGGGPSGFVACPTHARTTWCLSRGERGLARHGPWARFGESRRTNRRRSARQQGQMRGRWRFSG